MQVAIALFICDSSNRANHLSFYMDVMLVTFVVLVIVVTHPSSITCVPSYSCQHGTDIWHCAYVKILQYVIIT